MYFLFYQSATLYSPSGLPIQILLVRTSISGPASLQKVSHIFYLTQPNTLQGYGLMDHASWAFWLTKFLLGRASLDVQFSIPQDVWLVRQHGVNLINLE